MYNNTVNENNDTMLPGLVFYADNINVCLYPNINNLTYIVTYKKLPGNALFNPKEYFKAPTSLYEEYIDLIKPYFTENLEEHRTFELLCSEVFYSEEHGQYEVFLTYVPGSVKNEKGFKLVAKNGYFYSPMDYSQQQQIINETGVKSYYFVLDSQLKKSEISIYAGDTVRMYTFINPEQERR